MDILQIGLNLFFDDLQTGQTQFGGSSSKGTPGITPCVGSPTLGL